MAQSHAEIVALLEAEERDVRWAAATILGALRPNGSDVVRALARTLATEDHRLRAAALDSIASIGGTDAYEEVAHMLDEPGDLGHRAMEVVAGMGQPVLGRLKKRFEKMGDTGQRRVLTIAARLRGADGMDLIMRALESGRSGTVLALGNRIAEELASATTRDRNTLLRRLDKFLGSASARRSPESTGAAIDLLGRILGNDAQSRLLNYAEPGQAPAVRRRSLGALAEIATKARLAPELLSRLLEFLKDSDYTNVVAPAMSVLEQAKLNAAHAGPLLACLDGQDPALRRFAVTALGQVDTAKSATALLDILNGDNPDLQKRAAVALSKQNSAVPLVVAGLADAPNPHTAWVLARILHPHVQRFKPDQVYALAHAAALWLEPGDPRAEAVVTVLRDHHFEAMREANLKRLKRIKRDRKAGEIVNLLRPLFRDGTTAPAQIRYELAVAEVVRGRKDVVREVRLTNPGLQALEALLHEPDFALSTRLKRDKNVLTPEEYYLIGCHFAERSYSDRAFGGELLRWLVQTFPDDSSAHAAENKLLMEGFPPPPRRRKAAPKKKVAKAAKKAPAKKAPAKKAPAKKTPARAARPKKKAAKKAPKKAVKRKAPAKTAKKSKAAARKTKRR